MLSIGKIGGGQGDPGYYIDTVAKGQEDYYTGHGEAEGEWLGSGAQQQSLAGTVEEHEFLGALAAGHVPGKTVCGYDLTFSAPKSVSVLYGVGDAATARQVRDAHDAAVRQAIGYLEREACWTRRGRAGRERLRGEGLIVAAFRHRSSRAGDPQLHTHGVVANSTRARGTWTALDGRALYAHAKTAGYLYQAALRAELTRKIGLAWEPVHNGVAEIHGIEHEVLRHFSRRSEEIRERMAKRGGRSRQAARVATLETRRAKDYGVPVHRMREEWRARAAEMGLDQGALDALLERRPPGLPSQPDLAITGQSMARVDGVTREASTFDRRDVLRDWAEAHPEGANVREIEELADLWLSSDAAVALEPRAEGRRLGGRRYSTHEMLRLEQSLLNEARARRSAGVGLADVRAVDEMLSTHPEISSEQSAVIRSLTTSGAGVEIVRAAAGTGKTFALGRARDLWEQSGVNVYGCALAARAAVELESTAGIDSTTIAQLRTDLVRGYGLAPGSVLVVDEAGMAGTRAIAELADHTAETGSKLVLVGDDRQLPELDAGGAFRGLAEQLGTVELREVRRQREEWDRAALDHLRRGRVAEWANAYRDNGRIVARPSAQQTRQALVSDWWQAAREPDSDAIMIAHRRSDVRDLNALARERMRADVRLGEVDVVAGSRAFAVGDSVIARRNDRRLGVVNGSRGKVVAIDRETTSVRVELRDGTSVDLDGGYLDEGHLDYGYALTAHAAQGATVDRAFVLGSEDLYREWAYTALSRHRLEARFYVVSPGSTERCLPGLEPDEDPLDRDVTRSLGNSRRKKLATEVLDRGFGEMPARLPTADPVPKPASNADDRARREAADARAHAESLRTQAMSLPRWRRRDRAQLLEVAETHDRAAATWDTRAARPDALRQERDYVRFESTRSAEDLRALLIDPSEVLTDAIGHRPESLLGREQWASDAVALLHRGIIAPESGPPFPVELDDLGLDL